MLCGVNLTEAEDVRRASDCWCLVAGDGLLPVAEVLRLPTGETYVCLRAIGFAPTAAHEAPEAEVLRLGTRVLGDGEFAELPGPSTGVLYGVPI